MNRGRWISLAWGALMVAPTFGQSPAPAGSYPKPIPAPPPFQGQAVQPAVHHGVPSLGAKNAPGSTATFKPAIQQTQALQPIQTPNLLPPVEGKPASTTPSVSVEKRCAEMVNYGENLNYEIVVRNVSTVPVQNVRVEDEVPAGARYLRSEPSSEAVNDKITWSLGTLDPGAERIIKVEINPGVEGDFRSNATVSFSTTAALKTKVVRPKLEISVTAPDQVISGDPATFNIVVANPGSGPVKNLTLRVKLAPGLQHANGSYIEAELGTLAAGESRTVPLKTTAISGGPQVAEIAGSGDNVPEASARAQATVLQPQLAVRRSGPAKVYFKGEVAEEIEVTNPGTAPAANVLVTHILPVGFEFVSATDGALFDPASRTVTWKLGSQPAGTRRALGVKSRANAVGDQSLRLVATADRGLEARTDGILAVEGIPALRLEVVDVEDPVEVGGELVYEVRVVNQGSCPCTNLQIRVQVPDGLSLRECTMQGVAGTVNYRIDGGDVVIEPLPRLAVKADAAYRLHVKCTKPGDYRFKAQMTCDQLKLPVNKEESSRVYQGN